MSAPSSPTDSELFGNFVQNQESEIEDFNLEENESGMESSLESSSEPSVHPDSIQIASTEVRADMEPEYDPNLVIELGDRVYVNSAKHPQLIGTVYFRDYDMIRIKPDGSNNTLVDFEIETTDDGEVFKGEEDLSISVVQKRTLYTFVEQQNFQAEQTISTYSAKGEPHSNYTIKTVNATDDRMTIEDDAGDTLDLDFDFRGINRDAPFDIVFITGFKEKEQQDEELEPVVEEDVEDVVDRPEENIFKFVGFVDVVLPTIFRMAESHEQHIPDHLQKVDAFNDFISGLDPAIRNDPKTVRAVRILVETLFYLKQATIQYNQDHSEITAAPVSASTLVELIQRAPVPLGRPVLDMTKKEYSISEESKENEEVMFKNFKDELLSMNQQTDILTSTLVAAGSKKDSIIALWNHQQTFLSQYGSPWYPNNDVEPKWRAIADTDVFRSIPPTLESATLPGYIATHNEQAPPIFDKVPFGIERALSTTYRKGGKDHRKQVLLHEEDATVRSYLLFPMECANDIGSTRTRCLAVDSGRSQMPPHTIKMILEKVGEPNDIDSTAKQIILLRANGDTLSNIPLADYIDTIPNITALGFADVFETLDQYGMEHLELNVPIAEVLLKKIKRSQSQLIGALQILRRDIAPVAAPESNPFLKDPACIRDVIVQPILKEDLEEYQRTNPTLAESDIGQISYWMKTHPNYFQVAVGNQPLFLVKSKLQAAQDNYNKRLYINNMIRYNEVHAGIKPRKNNCPHVSQLVSIRRLRDDTERFQQLSIWFKQFQGARKDNWIECNRCSTHLLCIHENLQLQAYLHPFEKLTIEKDILLHFSGGQFQGKYICRNCGQPIRELDFDNHMEFDDDGKPLSGRAILVDDDAVFEEQIDAMLSGPIVAPPPTAEFTEEGGDRAVCYGIIKIIVDKIGIMLDMKEYRNIVDRMLMWIGKFPSREAYMKVKEGDQAKLDYNVIYSRLLICCAASFLLIEIQCKIPSVRVRIPLAGCASPGFGGYPLDIDESKKQGMEYIACAIASIQLKTEPWIYAKFKKTKEQEHILHYMVGIFNDVKGYDMIQAQLARKRKYMIAYPKDQLPPSFLPEPIQLSPEDIAKEPIIPESVTGISALSRLWIRHSHALAKTHAALIRGSPLMETSCCRINIETPGVFWKELQEQIPIPSRVILPKPPRQSGNVLLTYFIPRDLDMPDVSPDSKLYYRLFLKYCFVGKRVGYPHEPGLTNICPWCKFEFPDHPAVLDSSKGEAALSTQNVQTAAPEFISLLDTIHRVNHVNPITIKERVTLTQALQDLANIVPPPYHDWKGLMETTVQNIAQLPPDASRRQRAEAVGDISVAGEDAKAIVYKVIVDELTQQRLSQIAELSWNDFFNVLQNYIIIPFQRIISKFNGKSLFIPFELEKEISDQHAETLVRILTNEVGYFTRNQAKIHQPSTDYARARLQDYVRRISACLSYKNKIRPVLTSDGTKTPEYKYIQYLILYGPLSILFNRAIEPDGVSRPSSIAAVTTNAFSFIRDIIASHLEKYHNERLSFNDEEIKLLKAIRDEKERTAVIQKFDRLGDEEKRVELIKKNLKMGDWNVGKNVYAYNADYWDKEQQKRLDAGLMDFPGEDPQGRVYNDEGLPEFGEDEGYDVGEAEDD